MPRLCIYDEKARAYKGKGKVFGRIAGQMIAMAYAFLMTDYEVMSHLAPGAKPPEPQLYDQAVHKHHREGHYQPLKPRKQKQLLLQQMKN